MNKLCYKCKEVKSLDEFGVNSRKKDGRQSSCRDCCNTMVRQNRRNTGQTDEQKFRKSEYDKARYAEKRSEILAGATERARVWRNKNRAGYLSIRYARKRNLKQATPPWLTDDHKRQIRAIYDHARDCRIVSGQEYHVDHKVPLKHPLVCGLHVPWNLQVLPQDVNDRKGNTL